MANMIIDYLRESREELKRVTWPKRNDLIQLTLVVVAISAATAVYLSSLDSLLTKLLTYAVSLRK